MPFTPRIVGGLAVKDGKKRAAGIFAWQIDLDLFFGDAAVARLFDLDPAQAASGLPLSAYIGRIRTEDKPRIAKAIYDAILTGEPCQEDCRIIRRDGSLIHVMAYAHVFGGGDEKPTVGAGIFQVLPSTLCDSATLNIPG